MPILYDVYINDAPLAGHTDLTEAQLLNIDRVLNTSYPAGTNLKVQLMAKDGALTSLSDPVNLVVPVIVGTVYEELFTGSDGATLDSTKWSTFQSGTLSAQAGMKINNNKLRMIAGVTDTSTAVMQATYKTTFNFNAQNTIKAQLTSLPIATNNNMSSVDLTLSPTIPTGSTSALADYIRFTITGKKDVKTWQVHITKKYNAGYASYIVGTAPIDLVMTDAEVTNGKVFDVEITLTQGSYVAKLNGVEIARLDAGLGSTFTQGYPTFKTTSWDFVAGENPTVDYDNLYFVNP